MRLSYNILWCEDDAEWLEETEEGVKDHLKDLGFVAQISAVRSENIEELEAELNNSSNYDLILVDYRFNDKTVGGEFIKKIRDHNIYAEVVFYSGVSSEDLHRVISDHKLEGVYVAQRAGEPFYDKVFKVIETTVRKVLDLNSLRGIVMASTSGIDKKIFQIIKTFYNETLDDGKEKNTFREKILKRIKKKLEERLRNFGKVNYDDPWEYLGSTINFWSDLRIATLSKEILEQYFDAKNSKSDHNKFYQVIEQYRETSKKRNLLAHEEEELTSDEDGKMVIKVKNFKFDETTAKDIRKDLVEQDSMVNKFLENLSQKP